MLIKKRSLRHDYESAREVLKYMAEREYRPNLVTYGVLALTCTNKAEALDLLNEMQAKSYRLSIEILGAMLCQACYHLSFNYVLELMEICVREKINPSKKFMSTLEEFIKKKCRRLLNSNELTKSQEIGFKNLKARYKTWIQEVEVDDAENAHPWQQFQEKNEQDTKYYKWKDGARFKPRHASFFRVKTSRKHLKKNKK
ncbi:hypothetical protein NQ315_001007 [Exocentrus adspersus]|uniref:Pentatricopeptide repeat-containing protein n=1 Tax=Exocentrus adspersus TaxID=1586481 RepID=A0AAV8WET8_9CUCU|nr:hypothetical protein NQ315_001007 [Exocentrus adspersus]